MMLDDPARALLIAIAARDVCYTSIVLATLADGPATNAELRRAAGFPGDSFRSLLRRLRDRGLIVALPGERVRWALASKTSIEGLNVERLPAGMPPAPQIAASPGNLPA